MPEIVALRRHVQHSVANISPPPSRVIPNFPPIPHASAALRATEIKAPRMMKTSFRLHHSLASAQEPYFAPTDASPPPRRTGFQTKTTFIDFIMVGAESRWPRSSQHIRGAQHVRIRTSVEMTARPNEVSRMDRVQDLKKKRKCCPASKPPRASSSHSQELDRCPG